MDVQRVKDLLEHAIFGYAYHQVVLDDSGAVCDYRFLEANEEFARLTGLDHHEVIGKTVSEVIPTITQDSFDWIAFYGKLALEGGIKEFEEHSMGLDKWYKVKAVGHKKGYFSTFFFDITQYKQLEQKLSQSEERIRLLLDNSNDWVLVLDQDLKVTYSTNLGAKLLGLSVEELGSLDVFSVVHPEDLALAEELVKWLLENPNQLKIVELRLLNSAGEYHWLEVFVKNLLGHSSVNGIVVNARDITERKEAEKSLLESENRLRYITDNITDVVFLTDQNLITTYVSPSIRYLTGESPEEHAAKSLPEKHPPKSLEHIQSVLAEELMRDKQPGVDPARSRIIEVEMYRKDASVIDIAMHVSFIRDENGDFAGLQGVSRDVSVTKKYERELREKNTYIESLLQAIPDSIFVLDSKGMFTDLKPGNASSLYVSAEEVPGHSLFEIMPLDLAQKVIERIDSVISTQQTHAIQYKLEQNGEMKDFEARISYLDENHVISIVRDISEQRNALKSIQTQNRFQKMVAEVSTEFVKSKASNLNTILDNSLQKVGEFFAVQRAYLYRYSDDYTQLINTNEWASADSNKLHSKKRIYSCSAIPWWHNMILSGKLIKIENLEELKPLAPIEYQILKQQDIYSILCIPIQSGTKVLGYFGFDSTLSPRSYTNAEIDNLQVIANLLAEVLQKQDIEQKMQKQMKLQALISKLAMKYINLPSAEMDRSIHQSLKEIAEFSDADRAYIFDYDWQSGVCIVRNDWRRSTAMENTRQHRVLAIDDLLPWAELHKMGQTVIEEDVTNADLPDNLLQILKIQGIKSTVLSPLMHEDDCLGFVGLDFRRDFRNISDNDVNLLSLFAQLLVNVRNRKQLEDTLILEKERAEAASKAKSEFLANMSHEIRTPLNGVIGFAELLFNSGLENAQSQYANNIVNSSYNLLGIINDVLDLSKIEAGKLEISPVRTDLIELVEHAMDIIKVKTEQKGLEILLDMDPDLPQFAILDPLRVNQILINLLSNAEKFTDSGEIELKVSHKMIDSEHAEISFSVRDTGIGIDPTLQKRLFRAFSQLDSSTTRKYGGTGLGLVISNHLANLMKSKIELQSRAGEGSVFSFKISSRVEGKRRCDLQKIGKKRALVVDDNSTGLNILGRCLRYWHCEFSPFKDAENALKHLKQDSDYDFLMIDYDMPGMSGIELIKKIYAQIPDLKSKIPIILMHNAVEDSTLQQECTKLGLRHRILKPIKAHTLHELLVSLNSATGKPQAPNPSKRINMPNPTLSFSRPPQILITEDNYLNMVLLKEMILQQIPEAKILQASDGIEAIQELKNNSPDIVLMDVQMPNMDGVTASTEIRKISDVPIVAITAGALKEEQSRCLSAGMNDFLTKPVLANELMHVLLKYLDKPQKSSDADASAPTDKAPEKSLERFNKSKLLKNLSGDEATVSSLVEMVIESFPQKFESLENAIAENDKGQIKSLLHALKGTSQNMQFEILGQMIAGLEREFAGLEPQMIQSRYQNILKEWKQVLELIS